MAKQFDITQFALKDPRKDLNYLAHAAEQAGRHEDMIKLLRAIVTLVDQKESLTTEERSLLSVAYKHSVNSRRVAWRTLNAAAETSSSAGSDAVKAQNQLVRGYLKQLAAEMEYYALDLLDVLEKHLIPFVRNSDEGQLIFYLKMGGDFCRYLSEIIQDKGYDNKALKYYSDAMQLAETKLPATSPVRLGLLLNFSVFYYEILKDRTKACELAKKGYDQAESLLPTLKEEQYHEIQQIMYLLRDNLTLWNPEPAEHEPDADGGHEQDAD